MYITRHLEQTVDRLAEMFGAVLITGPRQVGKTTMLKKITYGMPYINMDDPLMIRAASEETASFFGSTPPVFVDEIQNAPKLFPYVNMIINEANKKGLFYFACSQQFHMLKNIGEYLAGQIGIVNMQGLSLREMKAVDFRGRFIPTEEYFAERKWHYNHSNYLEIWKIIHRGSLPALTVNEELDWHSFYSDYTMTYFERDVRDLMQIDDEASFLRFLAVMASMTGSLLNLAYVARDVGISSPIAERWLSLLVLSDIVYLLPPYLNNAPKRAIKTPKIYFLDTGLAAYLGRRASPEALEEGAMAGALFETFVVSEIIKSYSNAGLGLPLYFYSDRDGNEIDLLIYSEGILHPIEIKNTSNPSEKDVRSFRQLDRIPGVKRGPGGLVCQCESLHVLHGEDRAIPVDYV